MANREEPATAPDSSAGVPPAVAGACPEPAEGTSRPSAPLWATLTATFFGIGHLHPGPGIVTLIGIPAATRVARAAATEDPQFVVIDEVAGQLIALIAVPLAWKTFLAGLILFRAFDIVKPPPVRQLERLPEGTGIVLDDVAAGIFALVGMHLLLHFRLLNS